LTIAASLNPSALSGKNLASSCALPEARKPDICHAAVLLELTAEMLLSL
jgi:hypothetical protein